MLLFTSQQRAKEPWSGQWTTKVSYTLLHHELTWRSQISSVPRIAC
jgi:hypothetical protein